MYYIGRPQPFLYSMRKLNNKKEKENDTKIFSVVARPIPGVCTRKKERIFFFFILLSAIKCVVR